MGEILVCEMKTWHPGPVRESLRGDTTPTSHAVGCALGPALMHITSLKPRSRPARGQPYHTVGQAGQGYEAKLVTGPPSQEVPALGLGICKPWSEPPSHRPCRHSLVQWVSGRNLLCASSTRHAVRNEIHVSRFRSLEPTVRWNNRRLSPVPRGGECVSGLGHQVEVEAGLLAPRTPQEQAGLGGEEM